MSDANRRTVRTALAWLLSLAAALPGIIDASGISESLPWVAGGLGVAAAVTRVMALPSVDTLLPAWLRKDAPQESTGNQ
ncbi:hypothetical protein [Streptomyces iconiensis]|uniref:Holin n=1 Tax=Streptomyces iconiensis TaxID=1384038 RepID=A0ABT7A4D5_9ACTN|nr:hypothetical protein [Streptomyces iconiensis]MDJ1136205.1 hypothetical protein [Streptomyces iconiensis]